MHTTSSEKSFETKVSIQNIAFEDNVLSADEVTTVFEVVRRLNIVTGQLDKIVSQKEVKCNIKKMLFPLREVSVRELSIYRRQNISSFILKDNGKLYYSEIPSNMNFVAAEIIGEHKCAEIHKECQHLSAASDEDGGCAKVRDFSIGIERYPWITKGYETFGTKSNSFVVINCNHYEKCKPKKNLSVFEIKELRRSLAAFIYDDISFLP